MSAKWELIVLNVGLSRGQPIQLINLTQYITIGYKKYHNFALARTMIIILKW